MKKIEKMPSVLVDQDTVIIKLNETVDAINDIIDIMNVRASEITIDMRPQDPPHITEE